MTSVSRLQRKCFFASSHYVESFWGKNIYIFEGDGCLRLTSESLRLEGIELPIDIPFDSIKNILSTRFSSFAKPFGLSRLTVTYIVGEHPQTIHLVPCESAFDSSKVTSALVESWLETLYEVEELTNRVERPGFQRESASPGHLGFLLTAGLVFLATIASGVWLINLI